MSNQQPFNLSLERLSSVLREQHETFFNVDLGIPREILPEIAAGLASPQIIVITGLRRVGKSTLLAQIAQTQLSGRYYFVNFEDERFLNFTADQFDRLHEALIALFGERKIFLFDEIQNVPDWERFARRLQDQGYKLIITGSNSSLLSQELGTRLTGRSLRYELLPFSFTEYLYFLGFEVPQTSALTTKERGTLLKHVREYLVRGGIPDALKYPQLNIHKTLYDDVLFRDIAARYRIENVKSLQELALTLISNPASEISYNKLKANLKLGSVNTVKKYISYLENAWLFFTINKYAYSVKEQQIAAKKIYAIDSGMLNSVGFSFSKNTGKLMENLAFIHLRRHHQDIYYYRTHQNHQVDFFVPSQQLAIQVAQEMSDEETRQREIRALVELSVERDNLQSLHIITLADKESITMESVVIKVFPIYEWLLSSPSS
jgi:predicted AAA+ superfamily ATPase